MSAVAYRWEAPRTSYPPPVRRQRVRDLDQGKLWREAQRRAKLKRRMRRSPEPEKPVTERIESAIAELETFIDDVDRML